MEKDSFKYLLGDAHNWALRNIKSDELVVRGVAERLLNLHSGYNNLLSAVEGLAKQRSNGVETFDAILGKPLVELDAELKKFRFELEEFIPRVLPGAGTPEGPKRLLAPKGTITRMNEFNTRVNGFNATAKQLSQRAAAASSVIARLPLKHWLLWRPPKGGPRPKMP